MVKKTLAGVVVVAAMIAAPITSWACEGAGPATHIGKVTSVDAAAKTFTIRDVQSQGPITFTADADIINGVKSATGMVTVKYQEKNGGLTAVGVTF